MKDLLPLPNRDDRSLRWWVHESGTRWVNSVRRFHKELLASVSHPIIENASLGTITRNLHSSQPGVFLWEISRKNLVECVDRLSQTLWSNPNHLQLIACDRLNDSQRIALSEFNIACFLDQPEDMIRLKPIFEGYFARIG